MSCADADMRDHLACLRAPVDIDPRQTNLEIVQRALCQADAGLPPCPCASGKPCIAKDYEVPARFAVRALADHERLTSPNVLQLGARAS